MPVFDASTWTGRQPLPWPGLPVMAWRTRRFAIIVGPLAHLRAYGLQICHGRRDPAPLYGSLWLRTYTLPLLRR